MAFGLAGAFSGTASSQEPPLASPLTFDEAIAIALEAQPGGRIAEVALDREGGVVIIDIEVVVDTGDEAEIQLDAATGEILKHFMDPAPNDDPGPHGDDDTAN